MITHLELDILECEVKWALGSITVNKAGRWWNSSWAISIPERWCCESAKLNMRGIWKIQQWPQDRKSSVFITIPKKGNAKECSNYHTIAFISHTSKVMLKILQTRLQQYLNHECPEVQAGFRKGRGTRDQIANIHWIIEKAREFQENIYFYWLCQSLCVDHIKLWKILKEMGIPDHTTCLLRNLYAGQKQQLELDMEQQTGSK